jgi:hypothetical protein
MAPEKSQKDPYFSRIHALYENLDNILHPITKRLPKKDIADKVIFEPSFAPEIDAIEVETDKGTLTFIKKDCIYFEALTPKQQEKVKAELINYNKGGNNLMFLAPKYCETKKCTGHHNLENLVINELPENLSRCYVYFIA